MLHSCMLWLQIKTKKNKNFSQHPVPQYTAEEERMLSRELKRQRQNREARRFVFS